MFTPCCKTCRTLYSYFCTTALLFKATTAPSIHALQIQTQFNAMLSSKCFDNLCCAECVWQLQLHNHHVLQRFQLWNLTTVHIWPPPNFNIITHSFYYSTTFAILLLSPEHTTHRKNQRFLGKIQGDYYIKMLKIGSPSPQKSPECILWPSPQETGLDLTSLLNYILIS